MYEIQRREATGNVVSGLAFILLGVIIILVSIAQYVSNMKNITVDADKIFAYAWVVIAVTGLFIGIIGVYEILKSFISLEQLNEWTKNAESHVSPLQSIHAKRQANQAAEMNQSQALEPAPDKGMAENGSQAKKHFAFLGKKEEKKPDSTAVYNKYNPQAQQPVAPPRAKPMMEQKFDYGIHEEKKQTFADKFLAENKEDPFEKYRQELGIEEEKPAEEFVQKPQFKRSAEAIQKDNNNNNTPAEFAAGGSLYESLVPSKGQSDADDDDGFFLGTNYSSAAQSPQQMQQQLRQVQDQLQQVQQAQDQLRQVQQVQEEIEEVREQVRQVQQQQEIQKAQLPKLEKAAQEKPETPPAPKSVQPEKTEHQLKPTTPMPTIQPPPVPKQTVSPTIKPPPIPEKSVSPTIKPPPIPEKSVSPTIKPPPIPQQQSQQMQAPPIPQQQMQMPPMYNFGGYPQQMRPMGYGQMQPVQNMYQPLPNLQGVPGMMPNQGGYMNSPFGFAGAFVDTNEGAYNPAMPPYTVHPFRPAQQAAAPQMQQEQAYNPAMPPYTVHPFRPAQQTAAPQMQQEQAYNSAMPPYTVHPFRMSQQQENAPQESYNSAMPPYTVHGFKPAKAEIAAPQMSQGDGTAYNSAMPPYTVHPFKPAKAEITAPQMSQGDGGESYNSAMPPYTVHPFKPAKAEITAPQMSQGDGGESYNPAMPPYTVHPFRPAQKVTAPQIPSGEQSYNSAMPPYTVHPFKAKDPTKQPLQPQLYDPTKDAASEIPETPFTVSPPQDKPKTAEPSDSEKKGSDHDEDDFGGFFPPSAGSEPAKPEPQPVTPEEKKPAPQPEKAEEKVPEPKPEPKAETQQPKRTQRPLDAIKGVMTQRGDKGVKKPPITQRLGEYRFSLFEELSGGQAGKVQKPAAPNNKGKEEKKETDNDKVTTGGKEMPFNFNSSKGEPERKKSFSEKFLNKNGKKATDRADASSQIVQNGTPAQRKFVDASEYDEWVCPGCGSTNQEYVGVCSCGERKPRNAW